MQENTQPLDIKRYIAIILRRKYIALSVGLAVLSICTWGSFFWPKTYESSSTVLIEKSSMIDPLIRGVGVSSGVEDRLGNLRNNITSRNILERVEKKLGLDTNAKNSSQYEGLIDNIRKNLNIIVQGPDLFTILYRGNDPKTVRDVVNTLVSEYIEENVGYRRTDAYGAFEFIQSQLLEYKGKLEESDRATREFRERNPHMVPQSETTLLGRLEGFQTAKIEADIRLKELLRKRDNLQKQLSGEKELTVAFVTREGSPQARLNYLNNQLMLLMTKYTDDYPEVIKVKSEIGELKRQIAHAKDSRTEEGSGSETSAINPIYQQLKEDFAKTDAEIESLRARSGELSRQQQAAQGILGRMPKEQEEWSKLQRDRNVYQRIYDELLQKLENARVSKDLEVSNKTGSFRIVDPAILPTVPTQPNRVKMILLGIILGIASGIGAVFGFEYFNRSFKDEASIESELKLSVLATIPKIITEEDELSAKKLDRRVFTAAGAYLFVIGMVLVEEFLYRYMGIRIINF
jgi:polysaccharide chain length determinant protein (PEP-CTERM system associated)